MAQALGHLTQQFVTDLMAIQVVNILEVVEVEEHQRRMLAIAPTQRPRLLQAVTQQAPIGQAGKGIVERQVLDLLLGGLALADIGQRRHIVADPPTLIAHHAPRTALMVSHSGKTSPLLRRFQISPSQIPVSIRVSHMAW